MINPYSIGKKVYLRAPEEGDLAGDWYTWFSDYETTQFLPGRAWPNTKEQQAAFYESTKNARDRMVLCICANSGDEHIGICNLSAIDWVSRHADVALVIGNKQFRTGDIAVDVLAQLLEIAFMRLNLMNLRTTHIANNPFTPLLEKIFGFKEVGRFEDFCYSAGKYEDFVMSQLKREWWEQRNASPAK